MSIIFWAHVLQMCCFLSSNHLLQANCLVPLGAHRAANSSRQIHWEAVAYEDISEIFFFLYLFFFVVF